MRRARFPDVILSRQALVNCIPDPQGGPPPGCHGGDAIMIHRFMHESKVPDETCSSYTALNQQCTPLNVCRNCFRMMPPDPKDPFKPGPCWGEPTFIGYGVGDYGQISGEGSMMREIYARGPIACSFVTTPEFVQNYANNPGVLRNGVFRDATKYNDSDIDHIMEVTGWGETPDGTKYWTVRNSWGTYWGVAGWFKLERGTNSLLSEEYCDWGVPDFDELDYDLLNQVQGDYYRGVPGGSPNAFSNSSVSEPPRLQLNADAFSGRFCDVLASSIAGAVVGGAVVMWTIPRFLRRSAVTQQPSLLG